ncbi:MAG: type II toxin-antitoxin system ParD family antitoxin [Magnetococcales bacterium]|nr:type II toxin-antitoxin system ParD family antitoxin [Magnetococcales bacterium]
MREDSSDKLGSHFEGFIGRQVALGRFGTASEVIRAGLRLLEEQELRLATLQKALQEGEASGRAEYSWEKLIAELDREQRPSGPDSAQCSVRSCHGPGGAGPVACRIS